MTRTAADTIELDWNDTAEVLDFAGSFSDRARKIVQRLLQLGIEPMDIDVLTPEQTFAAMGQRGHVSEDGWVATNQRMAWGIGEGHKGGPKFAHRIYVRACLIVTWKDDTEIGIQIVQVRYGRNGKVRPQEIRVGAPIYQSGTLKGISYDAENPDAVAARRALGMAG